VRYFVFIFFVIHRSVLIFFVIHCSVLPFFRVENI
jgi:hypothetical protein